MSRLAHIDSGVVFTAIVFFTVQCVGLSNCNIFCPERVPSICECHRNTTTTISLRCKNKELKEYPHFGETKVFSQTLLIDGFVDYYLLPTHMHRPEMAFSIFSAINTTTRFVFQSIVIIAQQPWSVFVARNIGFIAQSHRGHCQRYSFSSQFAHAIAGQQ